MTKKLWVLCACSGSGKSTYVKELQKTYPDLVVASADHYFMKTGQYVFKPEFLRYAHSESQWTAQVGMSRGLPVAIDNTNTKFADMSSYLRLAGIYGYEVNFVIFIVPKEKIPVLVERNVHSVPENVIVRQWNNLEEMRKSLRRNMKTAYPELKYTITEIPLQEGSVTDDKI